MPRGSFGTPLTYSNHCGTERLNHTFDKDDFWLAYACSSFMFIFLETERPQCTVEVGSQQPDDQESSRYPRKLLGNDYSIIRFLAGLKHMSLQAEIPTQRTCSGTPTLQRGPASCRILLFRNQRWALCLKHIPLFRISESAHVKLVRTLPDTRRVDESQEMWL